MASNQSNTATSQPGQKKASESSVSVRFRAISELVILDRPSVVASFYAKKWTEAEFQGFARALSSEWTTLLQMIRVTKSDFSSFFDRELSSQTRFKPGTPLFPLERITQRARKVVQGMDFLTDPKHIEMAVGLVGIFAWQICCAHNTQIAIGGTLPRRVFSRVHRFASVDDVVDSVVTASIIGACDVPTAAGKIVSSHATEWLTDAFISSQLTALIREFSVALTKIIDQRAIVHTALAGAWLTQDTSMWHSPSTHKNAFISASTGEINGDVVTPAPWLVDSPLSQYFRNCAQFILPIAATNRLPDIMDRHDFSREAPNVLAAIGHSASGLKKMTAATYAAHHTTSCMQTARDQVIGVISHPIRKFTTEVASLITIPGTIRDTITFFGVGTSAAPALEQTLKAIASDDERAMRAIVQHHSHTAAYQGNTLLGWDFVAAINDDRAGTDTTLAQLLHLMADSSVELELFKSDVTTALTAVTAQRLEEVKKTNQGITAYEPNDYDRARAAINAAYLFVDRRNKITDAVKANTTSVTDVRYRINPVIAADNDKALPSDGVTRNWSNLTIASYLTAQDTRASMSVDRTADITPRDLAGGCFFTTATGLQLIELDKTVTYTCDTDLFNLDSTISVSRALIGRTVPQTVMAVDGRGISAIATVVVSLIKSSQRAHAKALSRTSTVETRTEQADGSMRTSTRSIPLTDTAIQALMLDSARTLLHIAQGIPIEMRSLFASELMISNAAPADTERDIGYVSARMQASASSGLLGGFIDLAALHILLNAFKIDICQTAADMLIKYMAYDTTRRDLASLGTDRRLSNNYD